MSIDVGTNSYVTVEEADAYFSDRYGYDKWASETNKEGALISATQQLDNLCVWSGFKVDSEQDLAFPRNPDANPVPRAVKDAQCEITYAIVDTESTSTSADDALAELKAGSVTLKFDADSSTQSNPLISGLTIKLLAPYGLCGGPGKVPMVQQ